MKYVPYDRVIYQQEDQSYHVGFITGSVGDNWMVEDTSSHQEYLLGEDRMELLRPSDHAYSPDHTDQKLAAAQDRIKKLEALCTDVLKWVNDYSYEIKEAELGMPFEFADRIHALL